MRDAFGCQRSDGDFSLRAPAVAEGIPALGVDKKRRKAPCDATYHYVVQSIAADSLTKVLGSLVKVDRGLGHVALDGKRLRGSQHETSPGVHMLHGFSTTLQASVGSLVVPPDSTEMIEVIELVTQLPLAGAVVTGDPPRQDRIVRHQHL